MLVVMEELDAWLGPVLTRTLLCAGYNFDRSVYKNDPALKAELERLQTTSGPKFAEYIKEKFNSRSFKRKPQAVPMVDAGGKLDDVEAEQRCLNDSLTVTKKIMCHGTLEGRADSSEKDVHVLPSLAAHPYSISFSQGNGAQNRPLAEHHGSATRNKNVQNEDTVKTTSIDHRATDRYIGALRQWKTMAPGKTESATYKLPSPFCINDILTDVDEDLLPEEKKRVYFLGTWIHNWWVLERLSTGAEKKQMGQRLSDIGHALGYKKSWWTEPIGIKALNEMVYDVTNVPDHVKESLHLLEQEGRGPTSVEPRKQSKWMHHYNKLVDYLKEHGKYPTHGTIAPWLRHQRGQYIAGTLADERGSDGINAEQKRQKLKNLADWKHHVALYSVKQVDSGAKDEVTADKQIKRMGKDEILFEALGRWYEEQKMLSVVEQRRFPPQRCVYSDKIYGPVRLGQWLTSLKKKYKRGNLLAEDYLQKIGKILEIGPDWWKVDQDMSLREKRIDTRKTTLQHECNSSPSKTVALIDSAREFHETKEDPHVASQEPQEVEAILADKYLTLLQEKRNKLASYPLEAREHFDSMVAHHQLSLSRESQLESMTRLNVEALANLKQPLDGNDNFAASIPDDVKKHFQTKGEKATILQMFQAYQALYDFCKHEAINKARNNIYRDDKEHAVIIYEIVRSSVLENDLQKIIADLKDVLQIDT